MTDEPTIVREPLTGPAVWRGPELDPNSRSATTPATPAAPPADSTSAPI